MKDAEIGFMEGEQPAQQLHGDEIREK